MTAQQERVARRRVNHTLCVLSCAYHDGLPITTIDDANGFDTTEPAIYCGRDGICSPMQVGKRTWLSLSWHKMESGKYEVIANVS